MRQRWQLDEWAAKRNTLLLCERNRKTQRSSKTGFNVFIGRRYDGAPPPHHHPASRTALRDEARVSGNRQVAGGREVFRVAGRTPSRRRFLPRPLPTSVPQIRLWGGCRGVAIRFFVFCFCFPSFFFIFSLLSLSP